ncbi:MAG TPA: hypothetical protein VJA25_02540 [Dehalococcoidia bacterium]|nr:hypothetical protein [Dehalococcoidia bacterium]
MSTANRNMARGWLQQQAALVLDCTHGVGERGPRTFMARNRVAIWLDTGHGVITHIRADVRWLTHVMNRYSLKAPR